MSRGGGSSRGAVVADLDPHERPKDFFGCIKELEQWSAAERLGAEIDEQFATIKDRLDYFNLGLRSQFMGIVVFLLFAPVATGVIMGYIPIFGQQSSTLAAIYAYMLAFCMSIGISLFYVYISKNYTGPISKAIVNNLFAGATIGAILKIILCVVIYGSLRFLALTDDNIAHIRGLAIGLAHEYNIGQDMAGNMYQALHVVRATLIPTVYIVFFSTIVFMTLPLVRVIYQVIKEGSKTKEDF